MRRFKKPITWLLVGVALFYLFTRPANAADAVNGVFDGVVHGGNQLAVFFTNVAT